MATEGSRAVRGSRPPTARPRGVMTRPPKMRGAATRGPSRPAARSVITRAHGRRHAQTGLHDPLRGRGRAGGGGRADRGGAVRVGAAGALAIDQVPPAAIVLLP